MQSNNEYIYYRILIAKERLQTIQENLKEISEDLKFVEILSNPDENK